MPTLRRWRLALVIALAVATSSAQAAGFTFFLTGDTHYGLDLWGDNEVRNKATIDAMNNLPGTSYPASLGGVVQDPRGVLIAGDLTDTPEYFNVYGLHYDPLPEIERDGFNDDYAVDGSGRLRYPVYEGYGNHDVDNFAYSYTLEAIQARNLVRPGILNLSDNGLHYSWDWEGVHFVNLNIYPGGDTARAKNSLDFLTEDLATYVGDSGRPVVLMHHFGFDSFSQSWWTEAERQAYADTIEGFNILGIFQGHLHDTMKYKWNGYDVFNGSSARDGNFLVVRLENGKMDVAAREDNRWTFTFSKTYTVPEPATLWMMALGLALGIAGARAWQMRRVRD